MLYVQGAKGVKRHVTIIPERVSSRVDHGLAVCVIPRMLTAAMIIDFLVVRYFTIQSKSELV